MGLGDGDKIGGRVGVGEGVKVGARVGVGEGVEVGGRVCVGEGVEVGTGVGLGEGVASGSHCATYEASPSTVGVGAGAQPIKLQPDWPVTTGASESNHPKHKQN